MKNLAFAAVLALSIVLVGCRINPKTAPAQVSLPTSWSSPTDSSTPKDLSRWWKGFEDPLLDRLIARGLESNLDLREASARILEARALRQIAGAAEEIQIDANASALRKRNSANNAFVPPTSRTTSQWQAGFDAIWEFDFFGRIDKEKDAAQAGLEAAIESRRDVQVLLVAEIARNYIELLGALERWRLNNLILHMQKDTAALVRARFDAGLATDFDLARAEGLVASTEAVLPREKWEQQKSRHRLALLLGTTLEGLRRECGEEIESDNLLLQKVPHEMGADLPSDLLRRRPDIRQAEREVAQIAAEIGIAAADLFPRFSLTGSLGLQASSYRKLNDVGSGFWSFGPSMSWPILNAGKLRARIRAEEARHAQALARYEKKVLVAVEETENALAGLLQEKERFAFLALASAANHRALQAATHLYQSGLVDFLDVLEANRAHVEGTNALSNSEQSLALHVTALFKALGGGWDQLQN